MSGRIVAEVVAWDVIDGGMLGALIRCPDCPCSPGHGCDGDLVLHRAYVLPGGAQIDTWRDADLLMPLLDRKRGAETPTAEKVAADPNPFPRLRLWGRHQ